MLAPWSLRPQKIFGALGSFEGFVTAAATAFLDINTIKPELVEIEKSGSSIRSLNLHNIRMAGIDVLD